MKTSMMRKSPEKTNRSVKTWKGDNRRDSLQNKRAMEMSHDFETSSLDPKRAADLQLEISTSRVRNATQSGDLQGVSDAELSTSMSIAELLEEGQDLEGELVQGVESARDADQGEVQVHHAPKKEAPGYKDRNRL